MEVKCIDLQRIKFVFTDNSKTIVLIFSHKVIFEIILFGVIIKFCEALKQCACLENWFVLKPLMKRRKSNFVIIFLMKKLHEISKAETKLNKW